MDKKDIQNFFKNHYGSEKFYKRNYSNNLIYTEGVLDFQKTFNAFWVVDCIISYLRHITHVFQSVDDGFFVVRILVNETKTNGYIEIYREGIINNHYEPHITVIRQYISYIDLPCYDYKFYLILSATHPTVFTLLLPNEY